MSPLVVWAGHIHNPAAGPRPLDDRQQQPGEQKVGDEVHPQLVLKPISRCPVWSVLQYSDHCLYLTVRHPVSSYLDPGTVDKDVHPALGLQHLGRKLPHRGEAGQVTVLNLELPLNKLWVSDKEN